MRKLATFAGAFSAAVFLWRYGLWVLAGLGILFCLVGLLVVRRRNGTRETRLRLGLIGVGLAVALGWCTLFTAATLPPWEGRHKERDALLQARIDGWAEAIDWDRFRVEARFTDPDSGRSIDGLLYLNDGDQVRPGDLLTVRGTIYLADRVGDREITAFTAKGAFVRLYAYEVMERIRPERPPLRCWPMLASAAVKEEIRTRFGGEAGALATALVTGDRSGVDGHFLAMSRRAGLAHIVVVSGLHVSFLAGVMGALWGRRRRWAAGLTLVLLGFFALMAGGTASAWRAVLFCAAGLVAPLVGREDDPPTSLFTALMLLLAVNPYAAASISLQLSFAAVAGIQLLTPGLARRWTPKRVKGRHPLRWLWRQVRAALAAGTAVSLGAILFTTPLTALYFGMVSLIGPVSNLLTLWAVSAAFVLAVFAAAAGLLPGLGSALAWVGRPFLKYLLGVIPALGRLPFAAVGVQSPYFMVGLGTVYALVCLNLFWPAKGRKRVAVPVVCCLVLAVGCVAFYRLEFVLGELTVAVLDVGQGQAVYLRAGGRDILVDCGGSGYADAGDVAADFLADLGKDSLDLLVLTHYHSDHAGGVPELMKRVEVKAMALPDVDEGDPLREYILDLAADQGSRVGYITADAVYELDEGSALTLYAPLGDGGANERGLSALVSSGEYDVLITGDMNAQVERRLVKYKDLPDIELLVVGHHGSKTSTGEELLDAVRPELAAISVGEGNNYGHPAQEVLERLSQRGITIYRTDLSGTLTFHTQTGG